MEERYKKAIENIEKELDYIKKLQEWSKGASVGDKIYCYGAKIENAFAEIERIAKNI